MNSDGFKNKSLEMIFGSKTYVQTAMFMQVLIFHLCVELCNKLNVSKYLLVTLQRTIAFRLPRYPANYI